MKLLMFHAPEFWFKTYEKVLDGIPEQERDETVEGATVVFYHSEEADTEKRASVLSKMVKNIKWISGKFETKIVVLHSFNHLAVTKAPPVFVRTLIHDVIRKLENAGYTITETPFGYLNEWKMHVAGASLAKVYKEF